MSMLLDLHLFFIWTTLALVAYADEQGLLWIGGTRATLSARKLEWLHALIGVGLSCLIATGGLLFLRAPSFYLSQPVFVMKLILVATLITNSFFVGRFTHTASTHAWADLAPRDRLPLMVSATVSIIGWGGTTILGLLLLH